MPRNNFSLYIPTDKKDIIELLGELSTKGELSKFIVEIVEMHIDLLVDRKLEYYKNETSHWDLVKQILDKTKEEEYIKDAQSHMNRLKVVDDYLSRMLNHKKFRPSYEPDFTILAGSIEEDNGYPITPEKLEDIFNRKLKGEEIYLQEELLTTGGSE